MNAQVTSPQPIQVGNSTLVPVGVPLHSNGGIMAPTYNYGVPNYTYGVNQPVTTNPNYVTTQLSTNGGGTDIGLSDISKLGNVFDTSGVTGYILPSIDQFGYDVFGIGTQVANPFTGAEPFSTGIQGGVGSNIYSSFTPVNIGASFAGNLAADALGLSGEYSNYTSAAGSLIAAGAGFGPVGLAAGAFLGSALGGLFGGPDPNPHSGFSANYTPDRSKELNPDGTFISDKNITTKHIGSEFGKSMQSTVGAYNKALHDLTGIDLSDARIVGGYDVNHGPGYLGVETYYKKGHEHTVPDNIIYFDPEDSEQFNSVLPEYGKKLIQQYGAELNLTEEQIAEVAQQALINAQSPTSTTSTGGGTGGGSSAGYTRPTMMLPGKPQGLTETFDQFLTRYRGDYNAKAV